MDKQHCLIIADDLTGGADAGVQFAKRGLKTLLIHLRGEGNPLAARPAQDVLVINTITRGLPPAEASDILSGLLKGFDPGRFPILYKKIDSTLRGNIGSEIDAILEKTGLPLCFLAPSYPEQGRSLVGGVMMVGDKPLALTEAARDAASPVQESHIRKLLANQTSLSLGTIDLAYVASGQEALRRIVEREQQAGCRIIIFDAASRRDLATIAEVALSMDTVPLLAGSAGLSGEVARILIPGPGRTGRGDETDLRAHPDCRRQRLRGDPWAVAAAPGKGPPFLRTLQGSSLRRQHGASRGAAGARTSAGKRLVARIRRLPDLGRTLHRRRGRPIPQRITGMIAEVAAQALREAGIHTDDLALILTGGDTALGVLQLLDYEGIELKGELIEGIVQGNLRGGPWDGIAIVTKAGAFGKDDALLRVMERLEGPPDEEGRD